MLTKNFAYNKIPTILGLRKKVSKFLKARYGNFQVFQYFEQQFESALSVILLLPNNSQYASAFKLLSGLLSFSIINLTTLQQILQFWSSNASNFLSIFEFPNPSLGVIPPKSGTFCNEEAAFPYTGLARVTFNTPRSSFR